MKVDWLDRLTFREIELVNEVNMCMLVLSLETMVLTLDTHREIVREKYCLILSYCYWYS